MKYVMYPHGGSGNHGCEAIVRSSVKLIGKGITLFSNNVNEDDKAGLCNVCAIDVAEKPITQRNYSYFKALFKSRVWGNQKAFDELVFQHIIDKAKDSDYFLSIGGDNYCYDTPEFIYFVNKMIDKAGVKRILWGASVEPEFIDELTRVYNITDEIIKHIIVKKN